MNATVSSAVIATSNQDRSHRARLIAGWIFAILMVVALAAYGYDYYTLGSAARPFSPKHAVLRPSGTIGLKLGFLGLGMFLAIFVYPLRKKWSWLGRQGSARHWLDFHVLLGVSAPFVIAFHSSFKFHGFAGIAFWIMLSVSLSGLIGRYLYSQIPRRVNAAEISLAELQEIQTQLSEQLAQQRLLPQTDLRSLLRLPSKESVSRLPMPIALVYMMFLDIARVFRVAGIRRHAVPFGQKLTTLAGFLPTSNTSLERAILLAREEASLAKRVLFLSRSQQVFHLWHVVHKPFSYSFAVLALIHIVVVMMMGYF
ncbi:MAG TPA: hypothetical protein VFM77_10290 [Terriglobales bacterium]|nr:hypothetical protein [Terriglobales bacterium]